MTRNKTSKCQVCGIETKELFEQVRSCKMCCKNCSDGAYRRYNDVSENTKPFFARRKSNLT